MDLSKLDREHGGSFGGRIHISEMIFEKAKRGYHVHVLIFVVSSVPWDGITPRILDLVLYYQFLS